MNSYMHLAAAAAILSGIANYAEAQASCAVGNATPVIVRVEGTTELVNDIVLQCFGGTPTASGQPVPLVNVTLSANTNITNRLLGGGYMDALLTIDEPFPANPISPFGSVNTPANQPSQALCYSTGTASPGSCNYLLGTGGGGYETANDPYLQANAFTIYTAQQNAANTITWYGVPLDPPGPSGATRYIRLTNLRANAAQLGLSHTMVPEQVVVTVTISGMDFPIPNEFITVGFIQAGLTAPNTSLTLCGCTSHNDSLLTGSGAASFDGTVQATEGFANVFLRRNLGLTTNGTTAPATYPQNVPGVYYPSETGFWPSPSPVSPPNYALQPADSGTRILLLFSNIPAGVHVFLPVSVALSGGTPGPGYPSGNPFDTAQIQLIQAAPNGFSGQAYYSLTSTATVGTTPVAEASRIGNTVYAVYEVVDSDPSSVETATIPIALAFSGSTNESGTVVVKTSLAPLSAVGVATSDSQPVPRFASGADPDAANIVPPPIAGDFDGNGVPDRIWENDSTNQANVHYAAYAGVDLQTFNWLNTATVPTWHIVAVADFNGDGTPDLVWQDTATREVTVHYYGGGGGAVTQGFNWLQTSAVPGWTVVGAADFNGDGVPDLVWQNDTTREVVVHYYGGPGGAVYQGWNWLQQTSIPGWHVVGAGDFNRDGVPDLVWQNDTTGQLILHYHGGAGGAVYQGYAAMNNGAAAPTDWTVKAVYDVNGDGVPDLLWQNTTTHQVTVNYYGGPGGATNIGWNWISETGVPGWSIVH
ncbi:MAG: VCBS repeat-containing protein [Bryobacteraceae bacterium]